MLFENSSFLIEPILSKKLSCLLKKTPLALFNPSFFHMFLNVLFNRAVSSKSFSFTSNQSLKYRFSLQSNHSSFRKKLFSFKQYHYLFSIKLFLFNQALPFKSLPFWTHLISSYIFWYNSSFLIKPLAPFCKPKSSFYQCSSPSDLF